MVTDKSEKIDQKVREGADKAYDSMDTLRSQAKGYAHDAVEAGSEKLDEMKNTIDKMWKQAKDVGGEWGADVAKAGEAGLKNARQAVQSRPLQATAIALAVGVIIGALLTYRSDND